MHAFAAVRNADHAPFRAVLQALVALFMDAANADHAERIPARTALVDVPIYAVAKALARVVYAAWMVATWVATAASSADSRVATAAPTQAIFVAVVDIVDVAVCANAGTATERAIAAARIVCRIISIWKKLLLIISTAF